MAHTLLLADDSVTIQRVIELTFADEDVRVVAVGDGDQAIAALDQTPPDIVLADVGMPGKNGYEVAEHIRNTPRLAHIPIVLLTGAFEPVDQVRAKQVGCDGVLAKPFEPQLVISRVKELLARPRPAVPQIDLPAPPPPSALPSLSPGAPPWTALFDEPTVVRGPIVAPQPPQAEQYFDRLDAAFANLASADSPAPDLPLSYTPPAPFPAPPPPRVVSPPPPSQAPPFPPLADAFAALLAAEQSAPAPSAASAWPAPLPSSADAAAISNQLIEDVTRRVLDTMSDRVVRDTVAEIVSKVAERLVQEEIERIKNSIK